MTRPSIPKSLREKIATEARHRCGYCLTPQSFTAMPMHVEHIIPLVADGASTEDNLWLACPLCNGHKATQTDHIDPVTGETAPFSIPDSKIGSSIFSGVQMAQKSSARQPVVERP